VFSWEILTEKVLLEDPSVDKMIILKFILKKQDRCLWAGCIRLRIGTVIDSCKYGKKIKNFQKAEHFLTSQDTTNLSRRSTSANVDQS
jgi:hypothetical protein